MLFSLLLVLVVVIFVVNVHVLIRPMHTVHVLQQSNQIDATEHAHSRERLRRENRQVLLYRTIE